MKMIQGQMLSLGATVTDEVVVPKPINVRMKI